MYEVELKAHVYNKEELLKLLKTFATYEGYFFKQDTYYSAIINEKQISIRIRKESQTTKENTNQIIFLTYKQKELKTTKDNKTIEVNNEKECTLSDEAAITCFLQDSGFTVSLKKEKQTERFYIETNFGKATIEVCTINPIGTFIEIEILSPSQEETIINKIKEELINILNKCKIPQDNIENKYYSQLLKEINKNK